MLKVKAGFHIAQEHPAVTAWVGALFGWKAVDFLVAAQITAAILASLVSLCALIISAPKAISVIRSLFRK